MPGPGYIVESIINQTVHFPHQPSYYNIDIFINITSAVTVAAKSCHFTATVIIKSWKCELRVRVLVTTNYQARDWKWMHKLYNTDKVWWLWTSERIGIIK